MNDAELQWFCKQYSVRSASCRLTTFPLNGFCVKSVRKHALEDKVFLDAGKITRLLALLEQYQLEGKRVLIFSQVNGKDWIIRRSG
jgi:SWI/SNF-related matrix-associated actin-dependent regulator 1 of chromatin subfamily A